MSCLAMSGKSIVLSLIGICFWAGWASSVWSEESDSGQLEDVVVWARKIPENLQNTPVAVTTLSGETLERYDISSLETTAAVTPGLIVTRGNSGSGADFSLRGIGSSFSSIGIEQSVAVVVDGVYYGQGRVIDEGFVDLKQIDILKGPQALFFGKNSTAGVISITSADPGPDFEARTGVSYEFANQEPKVEAVISGPVSDTLGLRLVVSGEDMLGGYVRNTAAAGTYTTLDAATLASTEHVVPAPSNPDLPAEKSVVTRFTAIYRPDSDATVTLKATADHNLTGGTSWNDRTWRCPSGKPAFPGDTETCGDSFTVNQNPLPADIAATRPDMGRYGGQLYTLYDSYGVTLKVDKTFSGLALSSVTNYQHFRYSSNSDYDFTAVPAIWSDEADQYRAVSEEAQVRTTFSLPVNFLAGVYYQGTRLDFAQGTALYGMQNTLASTADEYLGFSKLSATTDHTAAGYGQVIWSFLPDWEFAAGARYTSETKNSFFVQPYINPFLAATFADDYLFTADQHFHNFSPEATLTWKVDAALSLYAAAKSGYKSGGFSNSAAVTVNAAGVKDLTFAPETVKGVEAGAKADLLDRRLRLNVDVYRYTFSDLQVDFYDSQNLTLITTNAGSAVTKGAEFEGEFLPFASRALKFQATLAYNLARYRNYIGPCYGGESQAQGCTLVGPAPDDAPLQNLSGKPTADAPEWTASLGAATQRRAAQGMVVGLSAEVRYSGGYSVSPFGEPLAVQSAYVNLDAALRLTTDDGRWQLALIGKNLTNNFVVTSAFDQSSTGTAPGLKSGVLADQVALFAPPRTVELRLTWHH
jgi:iron complex outermembrane receptor protein